MPSAAPGLQPFADPIRPPPPLSDLYIGLISGTSVDGIDAVLGNFADDRCEFIGAQTFEFEPHWRRQIESLIDTPTPSWTALGRLDVELGRQFAAAALAVLQRHNVAPSDVAAIGHHGQTVHHAPSGSRPFTIQIGDPNTVAARTGITTVADLRRYDMAVGGQGAPLVPAFHDWLLRDDAERRVVLNLGGIANITTLLPGEPVLGFDTGPASTLLDAWIARHRGAAFDAGGAWAAQGDVHRPLLDSLLGEPWFAAPAPKSTGRELFNLRWLAERAGPLAGSVAAVDVQATLAELTAVSIGAAIRGAAPRCERVIVCGGGVHNTDLMQRLQRCCPCPLESSQAHAAAPEWIEGLAFAWLATRRLRGLPGNIPSVTGAHEAVILGGIYSGKAHR